MKLCMIGTGYVGLVSGVCFSDLGNDVICVDKDINKINKKLNKRDYVIDGVVEKPPVKKAPSNNAVIGRYILPRTIFKKMKSLKPGKGKEIHITDAIQLLIDDKEKFISHNFEGKYLDCGTMSGYINSSKEIGKI